MGIGNEDFSRFLRQAYAEGLRDEVRRTTALIRHMPRPKTPWYKRALRWMFDRHHHEHIVFFVATPELFSEWRIAEGRDDESGS